MAKYIDVDELKKQAYPFPCAIGVEYAVSLRQIDEMPTVDVKPIVRGEWIKEKCEGSYGHCSLCKCRIRYIPQNYKFCPCCGADMREKSQCNMKTKR